MSSPLRFGIPAALLALAGGGLHPALAQVTADYSTHIVNPFYTNVATYDTTTDTSSPTFDRPLITLGAVSTPPFSGVSATQTAVAYAAHDFTAASTGTYRVSTTVKSGYSTNANGTSNFIQFVYTQPFDPKNALTNLALANNPVGSTSSYSVNLNKNDALTLVNAGRYNAVDTAAAHISTGTVTTAIDQYNSGSLMTISQANTLQQPGVMSQTLSLTGGGPISSFNSIEIAGLSQVYLGGLTATLTHDGISVNLFDRVGANLSNYYQGSSANFDGENYTFTDNGADLPSAAAAQEPPLGSYADPGSVAGGTANPYSSLDSLTAFDGSSLSGAWTLTIKDSDPGNDGTFLGFSFNATSPVAAVPEASTWIGMGMGCLALVLLSVKRRRTAAAAH